jgi:hypothetical protein
VRRQLLTPPGLSVSVVAAAAAVIAAIGAGIPASAARAASATGARAVAGLAAGTASVRPVVLINGERVLVTAGPGGGHLGEVMLPARGGQPADMTVLTTGGRSYVIPDAALPYLGRGLDLNLFELSALQRLEQHGRLPVRVSFHGRLPVLPGVRVTRSGPGTATGYLTPSSARLFGAALDRQHTSDHARVGYGTDGPFAGGASISLAEAAAPAAAPSGLPRHTLTVTASNLAGEPDSGGRVFVSNVDNSNRFSGLSHFRHGSTRFSVPAGHYWAIGVFMEANARGFTQQRLVILPQFTVTSNTVVHLAERAASSKVTMVTPRPAVAEDSDFEIRRLGGAGPVQFEAFSDAGLSLWVSPAAGRPTVGTLQTFTAQQLVSPAHAAGTRYEYTLAYQGPDGVIPRQRHVVQTPGLARVDARYFQDVTTTGAEVRFGLFPSQLNDLQFESVNYFTMPRHQIEYLTGNPSIQWFDGVWQCYPSAPRLGGQNDAVRSFRAGERMHENWNAYPLHPGPNINLLPPPDRASTLANPATLPSASRAGNTLTLDVTPFSDNQPGHTGAGFSAASYQIDQNGTKIAAGNAANGARDLILHATLTPKPAVIRFALSASRAGAAYPLSSRTYTVWTWRSVPDPRATLPRGWTCRIRPLGALPRRCAVQPMLTLSYAVAGLALNGSAAPGRQAVAITAGHLQLAHAAPIAAAAAWVSVNDGRTWQAVPVTRRSAARFVATFTAPAGSYVTLRVRAVDAAAGSITETIDRSYRIAA